MGNRQMNPRGAAVQDRRHKAARNLSRAGAVRVHTRRLARASRSNGMDRLGIWVMVDGIAAETKTQRRCG
jgi:hypothetical protein